jgi:hypothetical protein
MYKLATYIVVPYFFNLPCLLVIEWVTKMRPGSNSVEVHPELTHNGHPVDDGAHPVVGAGSLCAPKCPGTSLERGSAQRWFFIGVISPKKREIKNSKIKLILEGFNRQQ